MDHKMQNYESNLNSRSVLRGDLLEFSEKLSLDQREILNTRIQQKMESIAKDINDKCLRKIQKMDTHVNRFLIFL